MSINEEMLKAWIEQTDKRLKNLEENQIAIVNGDFCDTDTEPKKPRIEDDKMRQCVKLWADINGFKGKLLYAEFDDCCSFYEEESQNELLFYYRKLPELKDRERYAIVELCGEEEEEWVTD